MVEDVHGGSGGGASRPVGHGRDVARAGAERQRLPRWRQCLFQISNPPAPFAGEGACRGGAISLSLDVSSLYSFVFFVKVRVCINSILVVGSFLTEI